MTLTLRFDAFLGLRLTKRVSVLSLACPRRFAHFIGILVGFVAITPAQGFSAPPQLGAAHVLRIFDGQNQPLQGSVTDPIFTADGSQLFFTLEQNGTHNLWRARAEHDPGDRFPSWRAEPITHLAAPQFAEQAIPLAGGVSILCVTNVTNPPGSLPTASQIVRLTLRTGGLESLTSDGYHNCDPALSPDGTALAFTSGRDGFDSVYLMPFAAPGAALQTAQRIALRAHRPTWLPNGSLLFDNLRPLSRGLYCITSPGDLLSEPELLVSSGGESAVSPDGGTIALAAPIGGSTQLYTLAPDGSGLSATPGTTAALDPTFGADGNWLAFDAPDSFAPNGPRHLWIARLVRQAPFARLLDVRPASQGALAIIGSLGGDDVTATLECTRGDGRGPWTAIPVAPPPVTEAPIALWSPTPATGAWTLRLTVTGSDGSTARDTFAVQLPLAPDGASALPTPAAAPAAEAVPSPVPSFRTAPIDPLPPSPVAAPAAPPPIPAPPATRPAAAVPPSFPVPSSGTLAPAPYNPESSPAAPPAGMLPAPAARPRNDAEPPAPAPRPAWPQGGPLPATYPPGLPQPLPPGPNQTTANYGDQVVNSKPPTPMPILPPPAPVSHENWGGNYVPPVMLSSDTTPPVRHSQTYQWSAPGSSDKGQLSVIGTLANMSPGQTCEVTAWVKNRGTSLWGTDYKAPGGAVRLVSRWIDYNSGNRRNWSYQWVKGNLAPHGTYRWSFALKAPAQPGHYKLIYGLVRVQGGFAAPPINAPQTEWPGEFAAIAFAVDVR